MKLNGGKVALYPRQKRERQAYSNTPRSSQGTKTTVCFLTGSNFDSYVSYFIIFEGEKQGKNSRIIHADLS